MLNNRTLIRWMSRSHVWLYRATAGRVGGRVGRAPVLLLTVTGRKSGALRTTPLLYLRDGDRLIIVASNAGDDRDPAWWTNLRHNSAATVQIGAEARAVVARQATADERERYWPQVVAQYPAYAAYQRRTSRSIPVVVLEPK